MTDLTRPVHRKSRKEFRNRRRLVVSLLPGDLISIREERRRKGFTGTLEGVYVFLARLEAEQIIAEKRKKRLIARKGA